MILIKVTINQDYNHSLVGKTNIEWLSLRSLLTSFSSVFHQDSCGILEIS